MLNLSDGTPQSGFPTLGELQNGLGTLSKVITTHFGDDKQDFLDTPFLKK